MASKTTALFIICIVILQANSSLLHDDDCTYDQWIDHYGKVYETSEEKVKRMNVFNENLKYIEASNADTQKPYKLALNQYADLTNEEFVAARNKFKDHSSSMAKITSFKYENVTVIPTSVDWRMKGAVTPVKHQGDCGSCWAFSAVGAIEGIHMLTTGRLVSLSEQQIVNCVEKGCRDGFMNDAFKFVVENHGIASEAEYPYKGVEGICVANRSSSSIIPAATITGYADIPRNDENAMLKVVANQPISVAINGSGSDFQFYHSGIYTGPCNTSLDHGVTVVGYGVSSEGIKYWLIKNSWGRNWGEGGYMRFQRGIQAAEGLCGIATLASYPIV